MPLPASSSSDCSFSVQLVKGTLLCPPYNHIYHRDHRQWQFSRHLPTLGFPCISAIERFLISPPPTPTPSSPPPPPPCFSSSFSSYDQAPPASTARPKMNKQTRSSLIPIKRRLLNTPHPTQTSIFPLLGLTQSIARSISP